MFFAQHANSFGTSALRHLHTQIKTERRTAGSSRRTGVSALLKVTVVLKVNKTICPFRELVFEDSALL